jgi:hypothetical protein
MERNILLVLHIVESCCSLNDKLRYSTLQDRSKALPTEGQAQIYFGLCGVEIALLEKFQGFKMMII